MSDYMKEAERLLEQYDDACLGIIGMSEEQARAALLAHIQRGAVPEGWQVVPIDPSPGMLDAAEAVDWGDEDTRGSCCNQWHAMLAAAPDHFRDAAEMVAEPAEAPMPEPDVTAMWNYTDSAGEQHSLAYTHDQMRTYGAACRDAGEAAGYARGLAEAGRDAEIEALRLYARALCKAVDAATDFIGTVAGGASWWDDVWADHAAALDRARERISQAALRGEVKP